MEMAATSGSFELRDASSAPSCMNSLELRELLEELFGRSAPVPRLASWQQLAHTTYRLRFEETDRPVSVIVKRLSPRWARRDQLAANLWLPALGLLEHGPPLLGVGRRTATGRKLWCVYEDLGDCHLDEEAADHESVRVVVELIARVHTGFSSHALLAACRREGSKYGASSFGVNVRDAIRSLESIHSSGANLSPEHQDLCNRLLERLHGLHAEESRRINAVMALGGPETLVHGDLWPKNVLLQQSERNLRVRLIDWERAGVGTVAYDLSRLLRCFPSRDRSWMVEIYREAVACQAGWRLPPAPILDDLFATSEYTRLAICVISSADAVRDDHADWALDDLTHIDESFAQVKPILYDDTTHRRNPSSCAI
jgi:hypothetical protein